MKTIFSIIFLVIAVQLTSISKAAVSIDTAWVASEGIDAFVNSGSAGTNYGTNTALLGFWNTTAQRSYIDVDLSGIPTNAIITKATLRMYASAVNNAVTHNYDICRVMASWTEGGITWTNKPATTTAGKSTLSHAASSSTGWQSVDILGLVQYAVCYPTQ